MSIHKDQITAAEAVLKPYISDPAISVAGLVLEVVNAFLDNAPARKSRTAARSPQTRLPEKCPDDHSKGLATAYWAKIGRHDLVPRVDDIAEGFRAHHVAVGSIMDSWPSAWVTWYRNAVKFEKPSGQLSLVGFDNSAYAETTSAGWLRRLETWCGKTESPKGTWHKTWGPEPKKPGCMLPDSVKEDYLRLYTVSSQKRS